MMHMCICIERHPFNLLYIYKTVINVIYVIFRSHVAIIIREKSYYTFGKNYYDITLLG
jgi:hypothetical protein